MLGWVECLLNSSVVAFLLTFMLPLVMVTKTVLLLLRRMAMLTSRVLLLFTLRCMVPLITGRTMNVGISALLMLLDILNAVSMWLLLKWVPLKARQCPARVILCEIGTSDFEPLSAV